MADLPSGGTKGATPSVVIQTDRAAPLQTPDKGTQAATVRERTPPRAVSASESSESDAPNTPMDPDEWLFRKQLKNTKIYQNMLAKIQNSKSKSKASPSAKHSRKGKEKQTTRPRSQGVGRSKNARDQDLVDSASESDGYQPTSDSD